LAILDLHSVYDATGSTDTIVTENNSNAVIPTGDGATTIGVSPFAGAVMLIYGAHVVAAAQALVALGLTSNNLVDPVNQLADSVNSTPAITSVIKQKFATMSYAKGPNLVRYANEAAGLTATFKIDVLNNVGMSTVPANWALQNIAEYSIAASGAATAGVYQTTSFAPTTTPPIGTYAILGLRISAITTACVVRFQHTDFGGAYPGIPMVSYSGGTLTGANQGGNPLTSDSWQGYQFVLLSQLLGFPCCPVFRVQGQGTGLNFQLLDTAADTAQFDLILQKIA
jgi:hypothetical protein